MQDIQQQMAATAEMSVLMNECQEVLYITALLSLSQGGPEQRFGKTGSKCKATKGNTAAKSD